MTLEHRVLLDLLAGFGHDSTWLFFMTPLVILRLSQDQNWDMLYMYYLELVLFYFLSEPYFFFHYSLLREL